MILAVQHQFEFWRHIGQVGGYFHQYKGFSSLSPEDATWPSKIFNLEEQHIQGLKESVTKYQLAKSLAVEENVGIEELLKVQGLTQTSSVEAMTMHMKEEPKYAGSSDIEKVRDVLGAQTFARIASEAFRYTIYEGTISPLIQSDKIQLFLGKHKGDYVSCGIVFQDSNGDSGLHMIGAKKEYRGLGLGKKMTEHLLSIALRNDSEYIHLVASKLGAPIYKKLGFQHQGNLKSYTI
ncbi:GNAT family N-acetyltransferase [Croceitalea rosinachiae]|uniref:GNAT family N-acetyltransferase n=1 Tax=Croceitalea rosinachiae TaxID=3075596 RepID=A0ABU3AA52_9FLAO|nr:GNAT family N-acetyltransferase [Croceitalea sp. F388]MDT0607054.1 GNAT family N-acetyltransferase [Croceitalea sp. F388]